jgi:hypothetical protein
MITHVHDFLKYHMITRNNRKTFILERERERKGEREIERERERITRNNHKIFFFFSL